MKPNLPAVVIRALQSERAELVRKRAAMTASIDQEIADLDAHLSQVHSLDSFSPAVAVKQEIGETTDAMPVKAINKRAMEHCFSVLTLLGGHMKSSELQDSVVAAGIRLRAADPAARLVQLLSQDGRFVSVRGLGWTIKQTNLVAESLKGENASERDGVH
jgi:hypothetical protein